ncbi:hypothetical protein RB2150_05753 [Rhodobacterales bacterium HTCC2150]|nr:hypothetical protein RB2150_05753 [Rhodobacterales bacterium HTCC2150] [Rhodobacteraceae bacterium HTCC2150]
MTDSFISVPRAHETKLPVGASIF